MVLCTVLRCLLPSEKGAIFDWILQVILCKLIPLETRKKVNLVITDGDSTEINSVRKAIQSVFPNASQCVCLWHLINQGLNRSGLVNVELKDFMKEWAYFLIRRTESDRERNDYLALFKVSAFTQRVMIRTNVL